jgi:hypothetical protein
VAGLEPTASTTPNKVRIPHPSPTVTYFACSHLFPHKIGLKTPLLEQVSAKVLAKIFRTKNVKNDIVISVIQKNLSVEKLANKF